MENSFGAAIIKTIVETTNNGIKIRKTFVGVKFAEDPKENPTMSAAVIA